MIQALQLNIILTFIQTIKTYITLPHFQIVVFAQEVHFNQFIAPFTNNATTATANMKKTSCTTFVNTWPIRLILCVSEIGEGAKVEEIGQELLIAVQLIKEV